jgi:hypothetical protein
VPVRVRAACVLVLLSRSRKFWAPGRVLETTRVSGKPAEINAERRVAHCVRRDAAAVERPDERPGRASEYGRNLEALPLELLERADACEAANAAGAQQ